MSKLSFRARALDSTKPMPVFQKDELQDLQDYSVLNRAVPQMPSGMEKEEESEHHLQRAISAQQVYGDAKVMVIPVPEAEVSVDCYNNLYKKNFRLPKHYVYNQAQAVLEQDQPDYDMDSGDERWLNETNKRSGMDISSMQFEEMIDRLEKACGNQMVTLQEAKLLLKEDDDLIKAVFEYWLSKRKRESGPLVFQVRQERRDGSSGNDCYVAFRRRTEKMQTRKNRKNDESSYEKMLKLRRDLCRAVAILEMVKKREKSKRELVHLTLEVFEKRYQMSDWDGKALRSVKKDLIFLKNRRKRHISTSRSTKPLNSLPSISHGQIRNNSGKRRKINGTFKPIKNENKRLTISNQPITPRPYTHKSSSNKVSKKDISYQQVVDTMTQYEFPPSSDEDEKIPVSGTSSEINDAKKYPDGIFTFRRKPGCNYYAPQDDMVNDWPWMSEPRHRYSLTTLTIPEKCVGFTRRRMGRGGRLLLDRAHHPYDKKISQLDIGSQHKHLPSTPQLENLLQDIQQNRWRHYQPSKAIDKPQNLPKNANNSQLPSMPLYGDSSKRSVNSSTSKKSDQIFRPKARHSSAVSQSKKHIKREKVHQQLDRNLATFATSALMTVAATPMSSTLTTTNRTTHISKVSNMKSNSSSGHKLSTQNLLKLNDHMALQKCVTCGGIVTLTHTTSDSKPHTTHAEVNGQQRSLTLPVSISVGSNQRTTVLPATVTVSMARAGGGAHPGGVPALLRISNTGAVVGGTVLYPQTSTRSDDQMSVNKVLTDTSTTTVSSTIVQPRRTLQSQRNQQRGSLNPNLALQATVLSASGSSTRATQSAPSSPRSSLFKQDLSNNGFKTRTPNAKTISLNLTSQPQTFTSPSNAIVNAPRITIAGNMLKVGSTLFSVALPQTKSTPALTQTLLSNTENLNDLKSKTKVARASSFVETRAVTPVKKLHNLTEEINHTVQIDMDSPANEISQPSKTTVSNTAPVKSSKPPRPMEVT